MNYEKGTAGGNIKINFPVKSLLGLSLLCGIIAISLPTLKITAFIMPAIFGSFAIYYLAKWLGSLQLLSKWSKPTTSNAIDKEVKHFTRINDGKIIGGVCSGLHEYYGLSLIGVRLVFICLLLLPIISLPAYLMLWFFLPIK